MLRHREVYASINGQTVGVRAARGCPQGGVLSPLLWSLAVDGLLRGLNEAGTLAIGYADDIAILVSGKFSGTVSELMQGALRLVEKWCAEEGLSVNPQKTALVPFTRRRNPLGGRSLYLYGAPLTAGREVKYLGVTLDTGLTFKPHLDRITNRAVTALWTCRRMFGRKWGLNPRMIHWIYNAMVIPIVTYASLVWWPRTLLRDCKMALGKVQRMACLGITGAMTTTPTAAMETLLNLPPLHLVVKARALGGAYRMKINSVREHRREGHAAILREIDKNPILDMIPDKTAKTYTSRTFGISIPTRDEWARGAVELGGMIYYTDGSKSQNGAGAGIWGPGGLRHGISVSLGMHATIFQAEIYGVIACATELLKRDLKGKRIFIVTDSQAALRALASWEVDSGLVLECFHVLNELGARNRVKLVWVPGHQNIAGNEKVDQLAKRGSAQPLTGPEPAIGIPLGAVKGEVKRLLHQWHSEHWRESPRMESAKAFLSKGPSKHEAHCLLNMSKHDIRIVTGLVTGHCQMRKHLSRMKLVDEDICRGCGEAEETPIHVLCHCEAFVTLRRSILGAEKLNQEQLVEIPYRKLLDFIKDTELL